MALQVRRLADTHILVEGAGVTDHGDVAESGSIAWAENELGGAGVVELLPGTYDFDTTITIAATTELIGRRGVVITDGASNPNFTVNGTLRTGPYAIFNWTGTGTVTIHGLAIYDPTNWIALDSQVADLRRKNGLINGDMRVSQRATDWDAGGANPPNNDDVYTLDRWILLSDGNDIVDVVHAVTVPTGALNSIRLDVETINKKFGILQIIEQKNATRFIGSTVSLSFQIFTTDATKLDNIKAVVLAWDGAADAVTSDVVNAWNAEDTTPTWAANWTAENVPANLNVTNAYARCEIPGISIDTASAKNIGVFIWSDGFCDTAGKYIYITDIQLELGDVVTPFEFNLIEHELALCQRYYCKSYNDGVDPGTTTDVGVIRLYLTAVNNSDHTLLAPASFPVSMRTTPTVVLYDRVGASSKVSMAAGNGIAGTLTYQGTRGFAGSGTNGAVATSRDIYYHYTAEAEL